MEDQVLQFGGELLLKMKVAKLRGTPKSKKCLFWQINFLEYHMSILCY